MIVTAKLYAFGKLQVSIYDFPSVGDVLPKHSHNESNAHITIIARGKIKVTAGDWTREVDAGAVIDLPANQEHAFVSLEPNSRIVNITKELPIAATP